MIQNGYFRLAATAILVMVIIDRFILFRNGISEQIKEKEVTLIEYNNRKLFDCFNDPFPFYCGSPTLSIPPMPIYDSFIPNPLYP